MRSNSPRRYARDERKSSYEEERWHPDMPEQRRSFGPAYGYPHFMEDYSLFYYPDYYERRRLAPENWPRESRSRARLWNSMKNFFGKGPKGYKRSDERIREDACEALARHPEVDASDIEVDVREGHIYLRGSVENRNMKRLAEDAVEGQFGVVDVHNTLLVQESAEQRRRNGMI